MAEGQGNLECMVEEGQGRGAPATLGPTAMGYSSHGPLQGSPLGRGTDGDYEEAAP